MRDFKVYKEEMELALMQNACVESELYSIVACIIRKGKQGSFISLRDVSRRRKSTSVNNSNRFSGESGFPDFVVLERVKKKDAEILGCIEIKRPPINLDNDKNQLQGHVKSFIKVLYTNGLEWRFYDRSGENKEWTIELGQYKKSKIVWDKDEKWKELLEELDEVVW